MSDLSVPSKITLRVLPEHQAGFDRLFDAIVDEAITVRLRWRVYRALFGTNVERIQLFNSVSGTTALIFQDALWDHVILNFCRLADPPMTGKNRNDSVAALLAYVEPSVALDCLAGMVEQFREASQPLRKMRNGHIAHSDRSAKLDQDAGCGVSRAQVEDMMERLRSIISYISAKARDVHLITEVVSAPTSDEVAFLRVLYHGSKAVAEIERNIVENFIDRMSNLDPQTDLLPSIMEPLQEPDWLTYRPPDRHD